MNFNIKKSVVATLLSISLLSLAQYAVANTSPAAADIVDAKAIAQAACLKFQSPNAVQQCALTAENYITTYRSANSTEPYSVFKVGFYSTLCTSNNADYQDWANDRIQCFLDSGLVMTDRYDKNGGENVYFDVYPAGTPFSALWRAGDGTTYSYPVLDVRIASYENDYGSCFPPAEPIYKFTISDPSTFEMTSCYDWAPSGIIAATLQKAFENLKTYTANQAAKVAVAQAQVQTVQHILQNKKPTWPTVF